MADKPKQLEAFKAAAEVCGSAANKVSMTWLTPYATRLHLLTEIPLAAAVRHEQR
jgi:hypothetical protein